MDYAKRFQVEPGHTVDLHAIDAGFKDHHESHEHALPEIELFSSKMRECQYLMYAEGKQSLLICLQGLDAAGKDGTINHVLGAMNPQGCSVKSFKVPSPEEAAHDFLWRHHQAAPARSQITVFNRSHYETVLVERVHELVPKEVWSQRYKKINEFEKILHDSGTHILKFYLHIDADEQLRRFKDRIDDPSKHWKISENDYAERRYWREYISAFEDALTLCSSDYAPWFIIPANHKWFRNLAISKIIVEKMESLAMHFPEPKVDIETIRQKYHQLVEHDTS